MTNKKFNNWSVEQGDYKRDDDATYHSLRKTIRRKRIKMGVFIVIYLIVISLVAYLAITSF